MASLLAHIIPAAFPALALAHFLALVSPGPDFFLIVGHAVRGRWAGAAFICVGIALGNAVYIVLACTGVAVFREYPAVFAWMEIIGSLYLAWLGSLLLRSGRQAASLDMTTMPALPPLRQCVTGLLSALLNVKNAIFYFTLMTVILGPSVTLPQQVFCGVWMSMLVLVWDMGLVVLIGHPKAQRALRNCIPRFETSAGLVLIILAASIIFKSLLL